MYRQEEDDKWIQSDDGAAPRRIFNASETEHEAVLLELLEGLQQRLGCQGCS